MPIFAGLRAASHLATSLEAAAAAEVSAALAMPQVGPATPFHPTNHLNAVVWSDLIGTDEFRPVTRASAMSIPAVARHRHLIAGTIARCPLVAYDGPARVEPTPRWATSTGGELSPYHRMLWTADDLIFYGWSVWRTARTTAGYERVAVERWEADEAGRIKVDGEYAAAGSLVLIPGPHEGILTFGAPAIRRSLDNLQAAATAARNPSAYLELKYMGDEPLTAEEKDSYLAGWAKARRGENGGVAWTNRAIDLHEHGTHESHLLIEGRNADAVDMARLVSNPAAMADATSSGASLTYETTEGRNGQFLDYGASLYMDAITARLSMDDVSGMTPGLRMTFDTSAVRAITEPAAGPNHED